MDKETKLPIELPYKLIDIDTDNEHLILYFTGFDEGQDEYSIKRGGVSGCIEVAYQCGGIESRFGCDITLGALYTFSTELDYIYDCVSAPESYAVLQNYGGDDSHTKLKIQFDRSGHFHVSGHFMNKSTDYKSGIIIKDITLDNMYYGDILTSLEEFFSKLKEILGHSNFY